MTESMIWLTDLVVGGLKKVTREDRKREEIKVQRRCQRNR